MNKHYNLGSCFKDSKNPKDGKKPKVHMWIDWCIYRVTVIVCIPFLLIGYGLGAAYALTREGWRIGRDI